MKTHSVPNAENRENFDFGILLHVSEIFANKFPISLFKNDFCGRPLHCIKW